MCKWCMSAPGKKIFFFKSILIGTVNNTFCFCFCFLTYIYYALINALSAQFHFYFYSSIHVVSGYKRNSLLWVVCIIANVLPLEHQQKAQLTVFRDLWRNQLWPWLDGGCRKLGLGVCSSVCTRWFCCPKWGLNPQPLNFAQFVVFMSSSWPQSSFSCIGVVLWKFLTTKNF